MPQRRMTSPHRMKLDAAGGPAIDQGLVHGLPVSFNPDVSAFHIHAPGTSDGTDVLATVREWRNLVQRARTLAAAAGRADEFRATTTEHLKAVLAAAERVLSARQDRMLTVEEWADLARAVAAATGRRAADLLGEADLEAIAESGVAWDLRVDGPLPGSSGV